MYYSKIFLTKSTVIATYMIFLLLQICSLSVAVMGRLFTYQIFKYLNLHIKLKVEGLQTGHLF